MNKAITRHALYLSLPANLNGAKKAPERRFSMIRLISGNEGFSVIVFCDCKKRMVLLSIQKNVVKFKCYNCGETHKVYVEGDLERGLK